VATRAFVLVPLLMVGLIAGSGLPFEERFFFQPKRELVATPAERGIPFAEVWFGPDSSLHGWFIPGPSAVTVLWLHGNGGNISHRLDLLEQLYRSLGASFFLFDYHGYGRSSGAPSEATLYADARAALAYVRSRPESTNSRIVYFGKSLGAAVAVQLAVEEPPDRLVLQSGFTSIPDLASWYAPLFPLGALLHTRFPTVDRIGSVRAPVLFVHGDRDEVVPIEHGRLLYEAASDPKCFLEVNGAGHDDLPSVGGRRYVDLLRGFTGPRLPAPSRCRADRPS
jgi:fermentation-respiration switch protein FrsA (DUF1100 family)